MGIHPLNADAMAKHFTPSEVFKSGSDTRKDTVNGTAFIVENSQEGQSSTINEGKIVDIGHYVGIGCGTILEAEAPKLGGGSLVNFA